MKLNIVITELFSLRIRRNGFNITNPAWRPQHDGYNYDGIIINLAFC